MLHLMTQVTYVYHYIVLDKQLSTTQISKRETCMGDSFRLADRSFVVDPLSQCSTTVETNAVVCAILSVRECI